MAEKITQLRISKSLIGLRGLEEALQEVAALPTLSEEAAQEALLHRVAARNYIPSECRADYRRALWREFRRWRGEPVEPEPAAGPEIKVLGLGCSGCRQFYQQVVELLAAQGIKAELQYITEPALLRNYEVRAYPALVINGRLVLAGQMPSRVELARILEEAWPKG